MFEDDADYAAFLRIAAEAVRRVSMRLLACCLMPNHWHLVLYPRNDGDLSRFTGWLTLTHTQRWHAHRHTAGQRAADREPAAASRGRGGGADQHRPRGRSRRTS